MYYDRTLLGYFSFLGSFSMHWSFILMICCEISRMEMYWVSMYRVYGTEDFPLFNYYFPRRWEGTCLGFCWNSFCANVADTVSKHACSVACSLQGGVTMCLLN